MRHHWILRIVKGIAFFAVLVLALGFIVMFLWNGIIPNLFKGPSLTYWQAVGLLLLSHILLRGWAPWRCRGGWRYGRWRQRFEEKLAAMTPEEREKFKQEWRKRCRWYPEESKEKTLSSEKQ